MDYWGKIPFSRGNLCTRLLWFVEYLLCDLIDCYLETSYYNNDKQYSPTIIVNKGKKHHSMLVYFLVINLHVDDGNKEKSELDNWIRPPFLLLMLVMGNWRRSEPEFL